MLLLLFSILSLAIVIALYVNHKRKKQKENDWYYNRWYLEHTVMLICGILLFFIIIAMICCTVDVNKSKYIHEKITMYEEENAKIEEDINVMVQSYMTFETETYGQFKNENMNGIALIQLYPELKSDTLVQQQIQIHTDNNTKIKQLKEKQIDYKASKWWLYFG